MKRLAILAALLALPSLAQAACPPIDPGAFWLPKDKAHAKPLLLKKAQKLNDSGVCAIDGSYGLSYKKYYISVSPTGQPSKDSRILRFTYDELKK